MNLRARYKDNVHDSLPLDVNQDLSESNIFGGVDQHQQGRDSNRSEDDTLYSFHTATLTSEAPVSSLLSIPHEVLLSILRRLSIDELRRCQTVCRHLRAPCRTALLDILSMNAQQTATTEASSAVATMFFVEFTPNDGHTVHLRCASVDRVKEELLYKPVSTDNFLAIALDVRPKRPWTTHIGASSTTTSLGPSLPRLLSHPAGPSVGLNLFDYQTGLRRETDRPFSESSTGGISTLFSHAWRPANESQEEDTLTILSIRHGMWRKEANIESRWDRSWEMSDHVGVNRANTESMVCLTSDLVYPRDNCSSTRKRGVLFEGSEEPPSKIHRHLVDHGTNVGLSRSDHGIPIVGCRCCLHHRPLRTFAAGPVTKRIPAALTGTRDWCLEYSLESWACCPCLVCQSRGAMDGHHHGSQEEEDEEDDGRREVRVVMDQLRVSLDWVLSGMEIQWFKPLSQPIDACHQNKARGA